MNKNKTNIPELAIILGITVLTLMLVIFSYVRNKQDQIIENQITIHEQLDSIQKQINK